MSLRLAIKDKHDLAEQHPFTKSLLSKTLSIPAYGAFLRNQLNCYEALEKAADKYGLFDDLEGAKRTEAIRSDLEELAVNSKIFQSTVDYVAYVDTLPKDKLMAHIYVRHMADMYGGQLIKQCVPTSGKSYTFENRSELVAKIRERLTDDMGEEANVCFDYAIRLFDEVAAEYGIR